jgi:hypothetical protein
MSLFKNWAPCVWITKTPYCLEVYQANEPLKQAGMAILTSDKVHFKPKLVRRDKEGHFILIKGAT